MAEDNPYQGYVDNSLVGSGNMHTAFIWTLADNSYVAYNTTDWSVQPDEVAAMTKLLTAGGDEDVMASGVHLAGEKYFAIRPRDQSQQGLTVVKLRDGGAAFCKSATMGIVGIYGAGVNPANCNTTVVEVAKYLEQNGL